MNEAIIEPPITERSVGALTLRVLLPASAKAPVSIAELRVVPGFVGPPIPHHHTREGCTWVVLEGTLLLSIAGTDHRVHAGHTAHVPPHVDFVWRNASDTDPLRVLGVYAPAGFEGLLVEVTEALAALGEDMPTPASMRRVMPPLWEAYGIGVGGA